MREAKRDKERLLNILEACNILLERSGSDTIESLRDDPIRFYGYVKLVEIIGEATYKLTKEFRQEHPVAPWDMMEGMRHILVHDYYRISETQLWTTLSVDIPNLKPIIDMLIKDYDE